MNMLLTVIQMAYSVPMDTEMLSFNEWVNKITLPICFYGLFFTIYRFIFS